jgi:hypothetical protein
MTVRGRPTQRLVAHLSADVGIVLLIVGLALILRLVLPITLNAPDFTIDFDFLAKAASAIAAGQDPYAFKVWTLDVIDVGYAYPPLTAWVLAPLVTALPWRLVYLVWVLGEMTAFAVSIVLALRIGCRPVAWNWVTLVLGVAFLSFVARDNFFHGQIDFYLLLLVTAGLVLLSRDREIEAGVLLAVAANGKPFLAILLLYLAWRFRWRAFVAMGFTGAAVLAISFLGLLSNAPVAVESWLGVSHSMGAPPFIGFSYNLSIYGTLVRLLTPTPFADAWIDSPTALQVASAALTIVAIVTWLLAVRPGRSSQPNDVLMIFAEAGLLLTLMFAVGPVAEANHLLVLVPAMAAAMRLGLGSADPVRRAHWRPAALAWGLFLIGTAGPLKPLTLAHELIDSPGGLMVLMTGRIGFMLLGVALATAWCMARERATRRTVVAANREALVASR